MRRRSGRPPDGHPVDLIDPDATTAPEVKLSIASASDRLVELVRGTAARSAEEYVAIVDLCRLAYRAGFEAGYAASEAEMAGVWHEAWLHVQVAMRQPTQAELLERRRVDNEPCRTRCGTCSRCVRHAAARANLHRFGVPDYPGTDALRRVIT